MWEVHDLHMETDVLDLLLLQPGVISFLTFYYATELLAAELFVAACCKSVQIAGIVKGIKMAITGLSDPASSWDR